MIMGPGSIFLGSEENTGFEELNPIEIPFIILTYYHHNQGVEFLEKISVQKGNEKKRREGSVQLYDIF